MTREIFETSDQVKLAVELQGAGDKPLIIWSHGFTGSSRNWRSTVRRLDAYGHLTYDMRGHARSDAPDAASAYTLDRLGLDLVELARHYGRGRGDQQPSSQQPIMFVGLSLGAMVSCNAAYQAPELVEKLVLSSLPDPEAESSISGQAQEFAAAIEARGLEAAGAEFVWGPSSGMSASDAQLVKQGFLEHPAHSIEALLKQALSQLPDSNSMSNQLQILNKPVLFLTGSRDLSAFQFTSRVLTLLGQSNIQHKCSNMIIDDGGHLLNLTSNDVFCQYIDGFFH